MDGGVPEGYKIEFIPDVRFLKPDGTEIEKFVGVKDAAALAPLMEKAIEASKK